ncbi:MAG: ABC transporter substrate-binding protein [Cyanobacteria bacterium P01_D01_bin.105]
MSQENNSRFAILATLFAFFVVGGISLLLWAITGRLDRAERVPSQQTNVATGDRLPEAIKSKVSAGEQVLFPEPSADKVDAIAAIAQGDYANAITVLNSALEENPNDPESFIYRSNARIAEEEALTLAVVAPSNGNTDIGLEILRGAAQAQYDINRNGGIAGMPLRLVIVDDRNDPSLATAIAETLVADNSVMGVVGHYSSNVTLATVPIYEAGELVTITPVSTAVDLSGISPYLYRTVPSDSFAAAALAAYMIFYQEDLKAAVYFDASNELSASLKEEFISFVDAWGGDIFKQYDLSQSTFDPAVQREAQAEGVEALMIAASPETLENAAAVINFNKRRLPILGGDDLYNRNILEATGPDAQALIVAVPWHLLSRDANEDFVTNSQALWQGDVNWRTASTYDAVITIAAALETDPTRGGLKNALDDSDFSVESATGPINFLPSGDRRQVDRLVKVETGRRSGVGYDFVPFIVEGNSSEGDN